MPAGEGETSAHAFRISDFCQEQRGLGRGLSEGLVVDLGSVQDCSGCGAGDGLLGGRSRQREPLGRGVTVEDEGGLELEGGSGDKVEGPLLKRGLGGRINSPRLGRVGRCPAR